MSNIYDGVRIIDFTSNAAGPFCTAIFADYGAEVIKIEAMKVGDGCRYFPPVFEGTSLPFMWWNRGKKSIIVDLKDPDGAEFIKKLVKTADVVFEASKPGDMAKFGLDYESIKAVKEDIIYCSISLNGQTGPKSSYPGYDSIAQARCGSIDLTGEADQPPVLPGLTVADLTTAVFAYGAITSALFHHERTGVGQAIDLSLVECLGSFNSNIARQAMGIETTRIGNQAKSMAPFGIYNGNGGSVVICAPAATPWKNLCAAVGKPEAAEEDWAKDNIARVKNRDKITAFVEDWLKSFDNIDEPAAILEKAGVPSTKILSTEDMLTDEQLLARGYIKEFYPPANVTSIKSFTGTRSPLRFSVTQPEDKVSPMLGEHLHEVLTEVGYSDDEVKRLEDKWLAK
ncbi:CoA transferase [Actinomycetota bacterium]|nr:CoA transferase [Actinomycetota bacterium]